MSFLQSLSLFLPRDCSITFYHPLSTMICGASRPSGALADCFPVATVVGGVLVVTIFAPIRGGNSDSLYSTIGNSDSLGLGYWLDSGHLTSTDPGQIAEY
jgi:hypothetical protein